MLIITGLRSGTSLMMQTLRLLDVPISGFAFHDDFSHKELNPKGYYNLPMRETVNGLNTDKYQGTAVKLGGAELYNTDPKYIHKIIWCRRNPEACKKSIVKLLKADFDIIKWEPTIKNADIVYDLNTGFTYNFFDKNNVPYINVYYEEMLLDTENTIKKVVDFIGISPNIEKAINNVDKGRVVCQQQ